MTTRITIIKTFAFITVRYGLAYTSIQTWLIITTVNHGFTILTSPTLVTWIIGSATIKTDIFWIIALPWYNKG
jgi:hypothetical protein